MSNRFENMSEGEVAWYFVVRVVLTFFAVFLLWIALHPSYSVYAAKKAGEAEAAQAEQNRQIRITNAEANAKAATLQAIATIEQAKAKAQAEIEQAKGVAEANRIIGQSLTNNPEYLQYLYINHLSDKNTIYVPTEAGLPLFLRSR